MKRDESQIRLADRIKQYENQGKELKKINDMFKQNTILKEATNNFNPGQYKVNPDTNIASSDLNNPLIKTSSESNQINNAIAQNKLIDNKIEDVKSNVNTNYDNSKLVNNNLNTNNYPSSGAISDRSGTSSNFIPIQKKSPEIKYNPLLPPNKVNASPISTTTKNYFNNAADLKVNAINANSNQQNLLSTTSYDQKYKDLKLTSTAQNYLIKFEAENQKKTLGLTNIMNDNQNDKYREYLENIMNGKHAIPTNTINNNAVIKTQETTLPNGVYKNLNYDNSIKQPNDNSINNVNNYNLVSTNNTNTAENTNNTNTPIKGNSQNNLYYNEAKDSNLKIINYVSSYSESAKTNTYNYTGNNALNGQEQSKNTYDFSSSKPITYDKNYINDYLKTLNLYNNPDIKKIEIPNQAKNYPKENLDENSKKILLDLKKEIADSLEKFRNLNGNLDGNSLGSKVLSILKNINSQMEGAMDLFEKEGK